MRDFKILVLDIVKQNFPVVIVKWRNSYKHFKQEYPKQVPIDSFSVTYFLDHFWGEIGVGAAEAFGHVGNADSFL